MLGLTFKPIGNRRNWNKPSWGPKRSLLPILLLHHDLVVAHFHVDLRQILRVGLRQTLYQVVGSGQGVGRTLHHLVHLPVVDADSKLVRVALVHGHDWTAPLAVALLDDTQLQQFVYFYCNRLSPIVGNSSQRLLDRHRVSGLDTAVLLLVRPHFFIVDGERLVIIQNAVQHFLSVPWFQSI